MEFNDGHGPRILAAQPITEPCAQKPRKDCLSIVRPDISFGSPIKLVGLISLLYELNDENVQVDVEDERSRRHAAFENSADAFSEDGVPVKNKKYAAYKKDGQGRVEIPPAYIHNFIS